MKITMEEFNFVRGVRSQLDVEKTTLKKWEYGHRCRPSCYESFDFSFDRLRTTYKYGCPMSGAAACERTVKFKVKIQGMLVNGELNGKCSIFFNETKFNKYNLGSHDRTNSNFSPLFQRNTLKKAAETNLCVHPTLFGGSLAVSKTNANTFCQNLLRVPHGWFP